MSGVDVADRIALESVTELARKSLERWSGIVGQPQLVMHRENTVFKVCTQTGLAALRIHRAGYHSTEAIQSELDWMAHLAANGLAVPAPLRTRDGKMLVEFAGADGQLCIIDLLTWLDGEPMGRTDVPLSGSPEEQAKIFRTLGIATARLHMISDGWQMPSVFNRHAWDREGLVGGAPFWGRFWETSDCSATELNTLLLVRDAVRRDLDAYVKAGADYGLIHADLVRENILVHHGEVRMLDFDDAGFGFRMFEIATALFKNRSEPHYETLKTALLSGYAQLRALSRHDLEALPLFLLVRALTYLGWGEARKHEPGMAVRRERFKADALALSNDYLERD